MVLLFRKLYLNRQTEQLLRQKDINFEIISAIQQLQQKIIPVLEAQKQQTNILRCSKFHLVLKIIISLYRTAQDSSRQVVYSHPGFKSCSQTVQNRAMGNGCNSPANTCSLFNKEQHLEIVNNNIEPQMMRMPTTFQAISKQPSRQFEEDHKTDQPEGKENGSMRSSNKRSVSSKTNIRTPSFKASPQSNSVQTSKLSPVADNQEELLMPTMTINGRIQDGEKQLMGYTCEIQPGQQGQDEAIIILKDQITPKSKASTESGDPSSLKQSKKQKQSTEYKKIDVKWNNFVKMKKKHYGDDYIVIEELGKGAFGTVSKVMLKSTNLMRAMKSIKKSSLIKEDQQKIFHEMAILQQMDHPNIIKLHQIYDHKNYYYLIMELCEGGELFDKIRQSKYFSERHAAEIMKSILRPVVYMHKQRIVHRDLKLENLLYSNKDENATLKIIDFGTARKIINNQSLTKQIGTAYYIAPEVLNKSYNEKCDVWSCGVILYILLCGYPPFRGSTEKQILNNIRYAPLRFDGGIWKKMNPDAIGLLKAMLDRDPLHRISALEALNSRWINSSSTDTPIEAETLINLSKFHVLFTSFISILLFMFKNRLKAVVLTYIASQLYSNEDKKQLQIVFKNLDKDGDGVIQRQQLIAAYQEHYREHSNLDVNKVLQLVDTNNSGKIDFTEFLVAASSQQKILNMNRLENAFNYFDIDKSGYITIEEIKVFLNNSEDTNQSIRQMFGQVDINGDGTISKEEFIQLLLNSAHT